MPGSFSRWLEVEPLGATAFAPFGEVVEVREDGHHFPINDGTAERYHDLVRLDTGRDGGRPMVSVFRARRSPMPLRLRLVERHQLGSQTFIPLMRQRMLVVVAPRSPAPDLEALRCFIAAPGQGVNYAAGTWHHPLIALDDSEFLVIDRGGPEAAQDCEVISLAEAGIWVRT